MQPKIALLALLVMILILTIFALAGLSYANGGRRSVSAYGQRESKASETEPNGDCLTANGPLALNIGFEGQLTAQDEDWYLFEAAAGQRAIFEIHPVAGRANVDTEVLLLAADCLIQLASNDDAGLGEYSLLFYEFEQPGEYFLVVRAFSPEETGFYLLTAAEVPRAPHSTCENAIDLRLQQLQEFVVNTCTGSDDYDPDPGSCLSWSQPGPDLVYAVFMEGGELSVNLDSYYDASVYLISDCALAAQTCLAGVDDVFDDDSENLLYQVIEPGVYYLILDSDGECGEARVTITSPLPAESLSWGAAKALYR